MNRTVLLAMALLAIASCSIEQGVKETGDAVQTGVSNVVEAVKHVPEDISKASNKIEAEIRNGE